MHKYSEKAKIPPPKNPQKTAYNKNTKLICHKRITKRKLFVRFCFFSPHILYQLQKQNSKRFLKCTQALILICQKNCQSCFTIISAAIFITVCFIIILFEFFFQITIILQSSSF